MPNLSFNIFKEKLLDGSKRQTIRKLRKRPFKVGDRLYVFWHLRRKDCERLFETFCSETFFIKMQYHEKWLDSGKPIWRVDVYDKPDDLGFLTMMDFRVEELAKQDGFDCAESMFKWFKAKYPDMQREMFQVVRWDNMPKIGVEFGTFEEFWKYCHGGCPDSKEGCAETCGLRKRLKIHPFGSFKWKGEIPKK